MGIIKEETKKEPSWVTYIKQRIEKKKNFLGFISGQTGSGKSWAALSICLQVDPTFTSERVVTDMRGLMKLINLGKLKEGSAILWDEAGIGMPSRDWQTLTNRLINFLLQTFRHRRIILIVTSPYMDFVDASTRKMFNAEFTTMNINYDTQKTKLKPQLIQYNSRLKKFYYKYLRIQSKRFGVIPVVSWSVLKPPKWIIEEYEHIKSEFTSDLNKSISKQLDSIEKEQQVVEIKPLTPIQKQVTDLMAKYDDVGKVAAELGLKERTVYFHIAQSRKKIWEYTPFLGGKRATGV